MSKMKKNNLLAQYLCGIITESQYHEALMPGGPERFDTTGKAKLGNRGTYELGEVHAVIHGRSLYLSAKGAHVQIFLDDEQIDEILNSLGVDGPK